MGDPNIQVARNNNVLTLTFANSFANPVAIQADGSALLTLTTSAVSGTRNNVVVKIDGVPLSQGRFSIFGNVLTFLSATGSPEFRGGLVEVIYDKVREGFDGFIGENLTVQVSDNDAPGVLIEESGGLTTVIEGKIGSQVGATDTYTVRLTKAPSANETVTIRLRPEDTRTSRGPIAYFDTQVAFIAGTNQVLESDGTLLLTFDSTDWNMAQTVTVTAKTDSVIDGGDTKAFANFPNVLNRIRGPLIIDGEGGQGSLSGLTNPVLMPGEIDLRPADGTVIIDTGTQITVAIGDLPAHLRNDSPNLVKNLINRTITLVEQDDEFEGEFRLITNAQISGNNVVLTINAAFSKMIDGLGFAITDNSLNFFANEEDQLDWLTAINEDSIRDELGVLTATRITGFGMTPDVVIAGRLQPGGITYVNLENLELRLAEGNDDITVQNTHFGTTTIQSEGGADTIRVFATSGHTTIDAGSGADMVQIGNQDATLGTLDLADFIQGLLTINGDPLISDVPNIHQWIDCQSDERSTVRDTECDERRFHSHAWQ